MRTKLLRISISGLALLALVFATGPAIVRADDIAQVGPQAASLPDQITDATIGQGANSSDLTAINKSAEAADDFNLATTGSNNFWIISNVTVQGVSAFTPTISSVTVNFYRDSGANLPGSLYATTSVPFSSITGAPNFSIPVFMALAANNTDRKYWVSVQAVVTSGGSSLWNWSSSSLVGTGSVESAWRNRNLDSGPCSNNPSNPLGTWNPRVTVCGLSQDDQIQMAFRLTGQQAFLPNNVYLPLVNRN
jgi:hypothetical protein